MPINTKVNHSEKQGIVSRKRRMTQKLYMALKLAEKHGLKMFPVPTNAKKPPIFPVPDKKASGDPEQLEKWFGSKNPRDYNIAVSAGASGLVIVDTDMKYGINGEENFMALAGGDPIREAELAQGYTFTAATPSGGFHRYYRYSGTDIDNSISIVAPGMDIRAGHIGYVLAPGSIIDGKTYSVVEGCDVSFEDLPEWLAPIFRAASITAKLRREAPEGIELDTDTAIALALNYLTDEAPIAVADGTGNTTTYGIACRLRDFGVSEDMALDCMDSRSDWNARCSPPWPRDELAEVIRHAYSYAQNEAGSDAIEAHFDIIPDEIADAIVSANDNAPTPAKGLLLTSASDVKQEPIEWLWPGHFAIGKIGGVAGVQGDGKSQTMCYIAATVSRGGNWPEGRKAPKGKVLLLSAEDDPADTIVPRLEAAGADLHNCALLPSVLTTKGKARTLDLGADIDRIEATLKENPDVVAVLIDPISAYLGGSKTDSYRTADVRALLTPLSELAAKYRVAVIFVTHFNKGGKGSALSRVTDSGAFTQLTRTFWVVIKEQDHDGRETGRMLFLDVKRNIGGRHEGQAYTIEGKTLPPNGTTRLKAVETSRVVWGEGTAVTPDEALAERRPRKQSPAANAAVDFLVDLLARGPVLSTDVKDAAEGAGHAWATLRRASEKVGVVNTQKQRQWWWSLPETEIDHDEPWPAAA